MQHQSPLLLLLAAPEARMSCHHCKTTKEAKHLFHCNSRRCRKKYCHDIDIATVDPSTWICLACVHLCRCLACQRKALLKNAPSIPSLNVPCPCPISPAPFFSSSCNPSASFNPLTSPYPFNYNHFPTPTPTPKPINSATLTTYQYQYQYQQHLTPLPSSSPSNENNPLILMENIWRLERQLAEQKEVNDRMKARIQQLENQRLRRYGSCTIALAVPVHSIEPKKIIHSKVVSVTDSIAVSVCASLDIEENVGVFLHNNSSHPIVVNSQNIRLVQWKHDELVVLRQQTACVNWRMNTGQGYGVCEHVPPGAGKLEKCLWINGLDLVPSATRFDGAGIIQHRRS